MNQKHYVPESNLLFTIVLRNIVVKEPYNKGLTVADTSYNTMFGLDKHQNLIKTILDLVIVSILNLGLTLPMSVKTIVL